jgi:hypothetical protein
MKKSLLASLFFLCVQCFGQTAANWSVTDCSGGNHELFADLDAGKTAVIIWVMPCANCINGALMAQTEVQNALASNPGKVVFYLADDNGNTNCSTLGSWASQNGVTDAIVVTSNKVSMSPYGAAGMPKIVVVGGSEHKVFYNQNAPNLTANGIRDGIVSAMAAPTGIKKNGVQELSMSLFPNPTNDEAKISVTTAKNMRCRIEVTNLLGQTVLEIANKDLPPDLSEFMIDTSKWANGTYIVSIDNGSKKIQEKLVVNH